MKNRKKDIIQFMMWMGNGAAYAVSCFLILLLIYNKLSNHQAISTDGLIKMMVWAVGAVFIFNLLFTRFIIKRWNFMTRLTVFLISICLYEGVGFYWLKVFVRKDAVFQWLAFVGIVIALYLICIVIYWKYSKKQGEIYTQALQQYQQERSIEKRK